MRMRLKDYLRKYLARKVEDLKEATIDAQIAQKIIEHINTRNADYIVNLDSFCKDEGEESVTVEYKGSIDGAIKLAESEFKKKNNRNDVQAKYHVELCLDVINITIPPEYYRK